MKAALHRPLSHPSRDKILDVAESLFARRGFALGLETAADVTEALVDLDVQGLPPDSLDTYRDRVLGATLEDVQRAARERLHPERAAIVAVGPAAKLAPALEGLGPVEIWQP